MLIEELSDYIDALMIKETKRFLDTVPYADHLTNSEEGLSSEYYIRHRIETIKRIRMTSKTDALSLAKMIDEDYEAARIWGNYINEEMNHDILFIKDLEKHGCTEQEIHDVEPFESTIALIDYLTDKINEVGSIPAVAYSLIVEWSSERYSHLVVSKAENKFSSVHVKGSKAHCGIDEKEDHYRMMLEVTTMLLNANEAFSVSLLESVIKMINVHLRSYFTELHRTTICLEAA